MVGAVVVRAVVVSAVVYIILLLLLRSGARDKKIALHSRWKKTSEATVGYSRHIARIKPTGLHAKILK